MTTTNNTNRPNNLHVGRPAVAYNCAFCGAFNNRGCFCGCKASRVAHNERVDSPTVALLDSITLVF